MDNDMTNEQLTAIEQLHARCETELFTTDNTLGFDDLVQLLIDLCNAVEQYDGETETIWSIGECGHASLDTMIVGAHWFAAHYHGGQSTQVYALLSATGSVYEPNMEVEDENDPTYQALVALHDANG